MAKQIIDTGATGETLNSGFTKVNDNFTELYPDVAANTLKTGITTQQAADIQTNNAKVGVTDEEENTINSVTTGEPSGSDSLLNLVSLTQAEYDGGTPKATTFYIITDA